MKYTYTGANISVVMAAREDIFDSKKTPIQVASSKTVNSQSNGIKAPNAVATALPPLKLKYNGYICPKHAQTAIQDRIIGG